MARETKIGTVKIEKPTRYRNQSEYARWYDEIEVQPCEVDLIADVDANGKVVNWYGPRFSVEGPVVSSDWSPCFGGVPIGNGVNKNLGEIKRHTCAVYAHELASAILNGKAPHVTLAGFEAVPVDFTYQGEPRRTYAIRQIAAGDRIAAACEGNDPDQVRTSPVLVA